MTVFNQEALIARVVQAILTSTAGPFELIVVFDGCTDRSAERTDAAVRAWTDTMDDPRYAVAAPLSNRRGLVRYTRIILLESRFETLANNVGIEAARAGHVVLVQDDMLVRGIALVAANTAGGRLGLGSYACSRSGRQCGRRSRLRPLRARRARRR